MNEPLIFEETTSPLYQSNDGRLRIETLHEHNAWAVVLCDGSEEQVCASNNRALVDAYIAGYDLAEEIDS